MEVLPHRYPFLLIDRIVELEPRVRVRGYKNITFNEPVFQGHFPGNPALPGRVHDRGDGAARRRGRVLEPGEFSRKIPYLAGIDKAQVPPPGRSRATGSTMEVTLVRQKRNIVGSRRGHRRRQFVCSAELTFSISSDPDQFGFDSTVLHA